MLPVFRDMEVPILGRVWLIIVLKLIIVTIIKNNCYHYSTILVRVAAIITIIPTIRTGMILKKFQC